MTTGRINQVSLLDMRLKHFPKRRAQLKPTKIEEKEFSRQVRISLYPQSLVLNKRQSCRVKELASTLSFFGFLSLRSRHRDLDENVIHKSVARSDIIWIGFQNECL